MNKNKLLKIVIVLFCFFIAGCVNYESKFVDGKVYARYDTNQQFVKEYGLECVNDTTN